MRLARLVAAVHDVFDVPAAMADVAALCEHDRYQAGAGIDAAAAYVASRAAHAGLVDVEVLRFPADGARHWWTFAAPLRWTPRRASVTLDGAPVLRYPEQPYALAANSAATPPGGVRLPVVRWSAVGHRPDPSGAMVVLEGTPLPTVTAELVARGAAGVVTDPLAGRGTGPLGGHPGGRAAAGRWPGQVGRLELPAGCPLFAFSATAAQIAALRRVEAAHVLVEAETGAGTLPVVTGRMAGADADGELLLSAHLCHPRPSANDNASGVAALLGIARAHRALGAAATGGETRSRGRATERSETRSRGRATERSETRSRGRAIERRAVRFVWAPEFVGMAAYLHDVVHAGRAPMPVAAVNVDMAGEDQRRCGGPLVIERAPDELPSPLSAVAERCAALIPAAARSYSGAVPCDVWAWRATPYVGASDHAMLAGPPTGCPAISLGHWPDAANHTSADTLDLVDPDELRRTATIAGATIAALRTVAVDEELAADVADSTVSWAAAHVLSALPGSRSPASPPVAGPVAGPVLDPWAPEHAVRLLDHRGVVALNTVRSLPGTAATRSAEWITGLTRQARALVQATQCDIPPIGIAECHIALDDPREPAREPADADVLIPCWDGPMNLRHLAECADPNDRHWLAEVSAHDRGGSYARLLDLARGLDGRRDRRAVAWWAALTSELAIPVPMAQRFLGLLCRAGWARPTNRPTGEARC